MIYRVYNHNQTFLGEFKTLREAQKEANYYMAQTGNAAFVSEETV
jgi:hypothetical protein